MSDFTTTTPSTAPNPLNKWQLAKDILMGWIRLWLMAICGVLVGYVNACPQSFGLDAPIDLKKYDVLITTTASFVASVLISVWSAQLKVRKSKKGSVSC